MQPSFVMLAVLLLAGCGSDDPADAGLDAGRALAGGSYHDTIRRWCGSYTGTYTFRAYYAPSYPFTMPVDCDR